MEYENNKHKTEIIITEGTDKTTTGNGLDEKFKLTIGRGQLVENNQS